MADIIDASQPGSPGWWATRLNRQLIERRPIVERAADYYDGNHNLAFASKKFIEAFGGLFRAFSDNWCGVVADAVEERLNVEGFRVDSSQPDADQDAWSVWQDNEMDAQSQLGHQESLVAGASYAVVWPDEDGDAEITVESATNTIIARHPKFRSQRRAGLRVWRDDDGFDHGELFLPDDVYLLRSVNKHDVDQAVSGDMQWLVDPDAEANGQDIDLNGAMPNPLGVVPVVEILNQPRLHVARAVGWAAHSEIRSVMPLQDAVNKLVADLLTTSEFAAFPQRYALGFEPDVDPVTNQKIQPRMESGAGKFWWLEEPTGKFGQFEAADLRNFVVAIDMVIQHIASISRTPPHYLNSSADRLSGESIKAAETGLVAKVKRKQRHYGEAWEEVMRLAGMVTGNQTLANAERMETIWADPESRTESEHVDAVSKKVAIGVPWEQAMEDLDYTPEQIQRMRGMRATEAFLNPPAVAPATPAVPARPASAMPMNGNGVTT